MTKHSIAVVLLNFNSETDLLVSFKQVKKQRGIDLTTIIVDNASKPETIQAIKSWPEISAPNTFIGSRNKLNKFMHINQSSLDDFSTYFIFNDENNGYSAGNNIGIKIADYLDMDAVLIVNPDMRIEDEYYIFELSKTLFSDKDYAVASSRIVGLDGQDQNPLRELSFYEEFFWPRTIFPKIFKNSSCVMPFEGQKIKPIEKTSGCCMLLKTSFLREIDYLDETTFLYSEEPILAKQVKQKNKFIIFNPRIKALHAHKESEKDNSSKRMLLFIKSRKYYLKKYSKYNCIKLILLMLSYSLLAILHKVKSKLT